MITGMILAYHIPQNFAKLPDVSFMMWGFLVRFSFDTAVEIRWRWHSLRRLTEAQSKSDHQATCASSQVLNPLVGLILGIG